MKKLQIKPEYFKMAINIFRGEIFNRKDENGNCWVNADKTQEEFLRKKKFIIEE